MRLVLMCLALLVLLPGMGCPTAIGDGYGYDPVYSGGYGEYYGTAGFLDFADFWYDDGYYYDEYGYYGDGYYDDGYYDDGYYSDGYYDDGGWYEEVDYYDDGEGYWDDWWYE